VTKKILVITDNLKDQINGVVTTFKSIEPVAKQDGYQLVFLDPSHFKYFSCPGYPEVKLSLALNVSKKIKLIDPDFIHIATEGPIGLAAKLYLDKNNLKYNTSYHTKFPEFIKEIYGIPECLTYSYVRWFHKHSGKVLTTSQSMVNLLKEKKFLGNILPWTRGVNRDNLPYDNSIKHSNLINSHIKVLYAGRVSKEKNLDALLCLQDEFNISVVGDGPYKKELEEKYKKVSFLGYKTGNELARCYQEADVFCFPSKADTFGLVMIEAMSLGTPVAAYPVQGPLDIITDGLNGYMNNDISKAIYKCRSLYRKQIMESSKKWTWEECWNIFKNNLIPLD